MNKFLGFTAVLALLAACDQRPIAGQVDDPIDDTPVGEEPVISAGQVVIGDLNGANYNPGATDALIVRVALDGGVEQLQAYIANSDYDAGGFVGYYFQDGADSRFFRALGGESLDGSVNAVVVADGGQFNRFFGGAVANQENYSAPAGGLSRYRGGYAGLVNFGEDASDGPAGAVNGVPRISYDVTGDVFILADFTEGAMNGEIYNRELRDLADNLIQELPEIVLVFGTIEADGSFSGGVELTEKVGIGSYGGLFGGDDASAAAGVVRLGPGFLGVVEVEDPLTGEITYFTPGDGDEVEFGVFVVDRVSTP